ncbi:PrsW family intramembrane metalloprotease [Brachybacterium huguangmaarense]
MSHPSHPGPAGPQQPGPGQMMPNGRPRPGAAPGANAATGPHGGHEYVDYGLPRLYDTSVRRASGLTRQRHAPHGIQQPQQPQPQSAWETQTRRVQQVTAEKDRVPLGSILAWAIAGVLLLLGIVFLGYVFISGVMGGWNPFALPALMFFAFLSLVVIIGVVVIADRWDPQPASTLVLALAWGAIVATGISYVVNTAGGMLVYAVTGDGEIAGFVGATFIAPFVEETSKGAGLLLLMLLARKRFNGPLDGLIYGALIGGGFAFTENILYYARAYTEDGAGGAGFLIFLRGVLGIFGHPIYTSLTGVVMGLVVRKWGTIAGLVSFLVATWPGMFLHALWNGSAGIIVGILGGLPGFLAIYAGQGLLYLLWIGLLIWLIIDEARLTRVRLGDYANRGWLTHPEVDMLATWKGRREGRRWAKSINAGPVMKRFIRESAELASNRQRLLADGGSPKAVAEERRLLDRLTDNRRRLLAHVG